MGHQSIVYGFIEGFSAASSARNKLLCHLNEKVIQELPDADEWPFIVKSMFSVTPSDLVTVSYNCQFIHFGASYKEVESAWEEWLEKFEMLLSKLFWMSAQVHLQTELVGSYVYAWEATKDGLSGINNEPPQPVSHWEFEGEPRKFYY